MTSDSRTVLTRLDSRIPPAEIGTVEAWVASGAAPVTPAVPSASVLLVRSAPATTALQVFVQHRHHAMAFAAGRVTFPGGRQEPRDDDLRACAVRELAEETGVRLGTAALLDWAHWITPECEPLRYDTRFYLAVQPEGQQAGNTTTEAVRCEWTDPARALAEASAGRWSLMPPTRSLLIELAEAGSLAALLDRAVGRRVHPVLGVPRYDRVQGWVWDYPRPSAEPDAVDDSDGAVDGSDGAGHDTGWGGPT